MSAVSIQGYGGYSPGNCHMMQYKRKLIRFIAGHDDEGFNLCRHRSCL